MELKMKSIKEQVEEKKNALENEIEKLLQTFENETGFTVQKLVRKNPATEGQKKVKIIYL